MPQLSKVEPNAHDWHLNDELIPMEIIEELAEMGVFGLTIPEEDFGGFGLSKASMVCRLGRTCLAATLALVRSAREAEIAAELILCRRHGRAEGQLASQACQCRRSPADCSVHRAQYGFRSWHPCAPARSRTKTTTITITGNKTWITHAARTHVMTLSGAHRSRKPPINYKRTVDVPGRKNAGHR